METPREFAESQIRRFITVLLVARAKRHLKTLADNYGWSPETLLAHEEHFIKSTNFAPIFYEK